VPPRVEYSLTQKGLDLLPIIESMREYGRRWLCEEVSQAPEHRTAVAA
jgi:DNA-binding HxlR family transcriptional regulator